MMLRHIGFAKKDLVLEQALDAAQEALSMPGDGTGNTAADFTAFVLERIS